MAKAKKKIEQPKPTAGELEDERIERYIQEYENWRETLKPYYLRFSNNYKQYTGHKKSQTGTLSKLTDPMAAQFIETIIPRMIERSPKLSVRVKGENFFSSLLDPNKLRDIGKKIGQTLESIWKSPEMTEVSGSMRTKLLPLLREFGIAGNCVGEIFWNIKREFFKTKEGKKTAKIVYDGPDFRTFPIERLVFNPARTLVSSDVYYVIKYVTYKDLESQEIREEEGITKGIYKNLKKLQDAIDKNQKEKSERTVEDTDIQIHRSKDVSASKLRAPITLLERWEGAKLTTIAYNEKTIIRDEFDPLKIGTHPLILAMNYQINDEPYAYSEIDMIHGLSRAKDTVLNQKIDLVNRVLNPPMQIDPNADIREESLANAYVSGGPVWATPGSISYFQPPTVPREAFQSTDELQARAEAALRISGYSSGVPQAYLDKTRGTKGGTMALIQEAQPTFNIKIAIIEEQIYKPILIKWLKMLANLMGEGEAKWILIGDATPEWVEVTKDLLQGKVFLPTEEEETEAEFDLTWMIEIETGSSAAINKQEEIQNIVQAITLGKDLQVPLDVIKIWSEAVRRLGLKDPEQYILGPPSTGEEETGMGEEMEGTPAPPPVPPIAPVSPAPAPAAAPMGPAM